MAEPLEDLDVYLDDWGEPAVIDGQAVRVLYGAPSDVAQLGGGGVGMSIDRPRVILPATSVPPRVGNAKPVLEFVDVVPGRAQRHLVTESRPDGTGMVTLLLTAAADQG